MNKETLLKYLRGEADEKEMDSIIEWLKESDSNRDYMAELKSLWMISGEKYSHSEKPQIIGNSKRTRFFRFTYFAAAALVALLVAIDISLKTDTGEKDNAIPDNKHQELISANTINEQTFYTEKGTKATITLPDGSTVKLNSDSRITYPERFAGSTRNVKISGEALFDVSRDPLRPMVVTTNKGLSIQVLGTRFLVKSYDNDEESITTLFSGSIKMNYTDPETETIKEVMLRPSESFTYYGRNIMPKIEIEGKKTNEINTAWTKGELVFEKTPMSEVIKMLERWHGSNFEVKNAEIYDYRLTASFKSESIVQILEMIQYCIPVKYNVKDNHVVLY